MLSFTPNRPMICSCAYAKSGAKISSQRTARCAEEPESEMGEARA